ncbi:unnamed protein product [Durusdinium trenchii]|uniref:Uncharacterized protein n=2 Tax=Durusdinium trenchii TaxID=1381693 RepID=A0ABP0I9D4_9DINO
MAARLRLSPYYSKLAQFAASDDDKKLGLDVDAKASEEITAICRHFDLLCEVLPAPPGSVASKRLTISRSANNFDEAEPEAVSVQPRPVVVSGKARLAERYGKKPPKAAVEAEDLLERSDLPKLADFYRALVDAYPGFHVPLAKLLTQNLRAAGVSGATSSSSEAKKRKKKEKKKEKKNRKKEKKQKKAEEDSKVEDDDKQKLEQKEEENSRSDEREETTPAPIIDLELPTAAEVDEDLMKELEFERKRKLPQN